MQLLTILKTINHKKFIKYALKNMEYIETKKDYKKMHKTFLKVFAYINKLIDKPNENKYILVSSNNYLEGKQFSKIYRFKLSDIMNLPEQHINVFTDSYIDSLDKTELYQYTSSIPTLHNQPFVLSDWKEVLYSQVDFKIFNKKINKHTMDSLLAILIELLRMGMPPKRNSIIEETLKYHKLNKEQLIESLENETLSQYITQITTEEEFQLMRKYDKAKTNRDLYINLITLKFTILYKEAKK